VIFVENGLFKRSVMAEEEISVRKLEINRGLAEKSAEFRKISAEFNVDPD
jgi:hypothetical protein